MANMDHPLAIDNLPSAPSAPSAPTFQADEQAEGELWVAPPATPDGSIETPFGVFAHDTTSSVGRPEKGYKVEMIAEANAAKDRVLDLVNQCVEEKQVLDEGQQKLRRREVVSSFASIDPIPATVTTTLPPIHIVNDSFTCFIYTTTTSGKKQWVSSKIQILNHSIILSDGDAGGHSKKGQREYSMSKGGEAKLEADYEGRTNVLLVTCVEGSRSKHLSFADVTEMNRVHKILSHFFNTSAAQMAELQVQRILSYPLTHLDQLTMPPHPSNRADDDLYKSAKACYATGAKLGMFSKAVRCDCCGNGFLDDQVKPRSIGFITGTANCCFKCNNLLAVRETAAKAMEEALDGKDLAKVVSILNSNVVPYANPLKFFDPPKKVSLISPNFSNESGLTPLLIAVTLPSLPLASQEMDNVLSQDVDVNARAFHTIKKIVPVSNQITERRRSKNSSAGLAQSVRSRKLSSIAINDRQITGVTPLMAATMLNRIDFIRKLLSKGADPTVEGDAVSKLSPLGFASSAAGNSDSLKALLSAFRDEETCEFTNLKPSIDFRNVPGKLMSALHVAADGNNTEATQLLLDYGADRECVDMDLQTPLHLAAKRGFSRIVQLLTSVSIENNENYANMRDVYGNTAMLSSVKACMEDEIDADDCKNVVTVLMGHSASVCTHNFAGECCLGIVEAYNNAAKDKDEEPSSLTPTVDSMGCAIAAGRWDEVNRLVDNKNFHIDYVSKKSGYLTALAAASKKPSAECRNVRELLRRGASPITLCGEEGADHAFNISASHGQDEVLVLLHNSGWGLNGGELDESQTIVQGGMTPLALAVIGASGYDPEFSFDEKVTKKLTEYKRTKCVQCVKYLLDWGFNPIHYNDSGDTPFILAARGGDIKVIECFVNYSKDPGAAANSPYSSLFSLDAPHEKSRTALMESAKMGRNDICSLLLEGGASMDCVDVEGRNVLHFATLAGETSTLGSLLKKSEVEQVRAVDNFGFTILHTASKFLHVNPRYGEDVSQMISMMVDAGVDITVKESMKNYTALDIIHLVPPSYTVPEKIITLLEGFDAAMHEKDFKTLLKYIERGNCDVDTVCETAGVAQGVTPLIVACSKSSDEASECVRRLIDLGGDVNYAADVLVAPFEGASPSAITPLLSAVMTGNVAGAELLLEHGATLGGVPVSGEGGSFILVAAAQARKKQLVERLIDAGVGVNLKVNGLTPMFVASANGDVDIIGVLLENGAEVDVLHSAVAASKALSMGGKGAEQGYLCDDMTSLMAASLNGHVDAMQLLLNRGGDARMKDKKGRISLHYAGRGGSASAIRILKGWGGMEGGDLDVNAVDLRGRTPLMDACLGGDVGAVECLLEYGCDPSACSSGGGFEGGEEVEEATPLSEAIKGGSSDVIFAINSALSKDDTAIVKGQLDVFIERVRKKAAPVNYLARVNTLKMGGMGSRKRADSILSGDDGPKITALGRACELKNPEWIRALVDLGADVNMVLSGSSSPGDSAVLICARGNDNATMEALLTADNRNPRNHLMCVNPNYSKEGENALGLAVKNDNGIMTKMLLEHAASPFKPCGYMGVMDWGDRIEGGELTNPFFLACATGKLNALKEIVKCMAFHRSRGEGVSATSNYNIDRQSTDGSVTGLMLASYGGHAECVRALCKEGSCNVTLKDRMGRTAAHFASMQGHEDVIVALCGVFGASASVKDSSGKNVEMHAKNDKTKYAARMAIAGEEGYVLAVKEAVNEAKEKVREAESKLETAREDVARAQEIVGEVEEEGEDMTVVSRFKALGNIITSDTGLRGASVENLIDMKNSLAVITERVEKEFGGRLKRAEDMTKCLICKVRTRDCVLMPCRHMACCGECAQHPRFRTCPLCLSRVQNVAADINLRAPIATLTSREGSLFDMSGDGIVDSQRGEEGEGNVPYAPVVILRNSNEGTGGLDRGRSSMSLERGDSARSVGGIITAEATVVGGDGE